jgi:hypothetical protein
MGARDVAVSRSAMLQPPLASISTYAAGIAGPMSVGK